jgi:hypothetical protein
VTQTAAGQPRRPRVTTISRDESLSADIFLPLDATNVVRNQQVQPPNNIFPNDRFLWGITLEWEGRITNAVVNPPNGVLPDAPFNLIDTIIVQGTDRIKQQKVVIMNVRGSSLAQLVKIQANSPQDVTPGAGLSIAPGAANDIRFYIDVPFVPLNMPFHQQVDWVFDATNYDALQLLIQVADDNNIFTYGAGGRGAPTFSAFGAATGSPRIRLLGIYVMFGPNMGEGFKPGRVYRYFNEDTSQDVLATAAKVQLNNGNLPRGRQIRSVLQKTGTKSTAVSSTNTAFATVSNANLANLFLYRGTNKTIRNYLDQFHIRHVNGLRYSNFPNTGYNLWDFAPNGTIHESLDLRNAIAGATGDILTYFQADVTTLGANSAIEWMYEELDGPPIYPVFMG